MKVVQFTIPVTSEQSIIVQEDNLPHFYTHLHRHNETQITWIQSGTGTLIAGNSMHQFEENEIYIIGANQPHVLKNDPAYFDADQQREVRALTIFIDTNGRFNSILSFPEMSTIRSFLEAAHTGLMIPSQYFTDISKLMLQVRDSRNGYQLAAFIDLLQTLAGISTMKVLSNSSQPYSITESEGLRMNDVYQFTMDHYGENITLQQIARIAHLTPQAFCRYFKKHTRKTYVNFLNEIRINEACKKITSGDFDSISSIAYQSGFTNAVTFNRVFKKVVGKAPRDYQKEFRQKTEI